MCSSSTASSHATSDGAGGSEGLRSARDAHAADRGPAAHGPSPVARRLFVASLLLFLLLSGGRIASSDGNTMFALSERLLEGHLDIAAEWNGAIGRGGHFYPKADPGLAILALPWVLTGQLTAGLLPGGDGGLAALWPRIVASTLNSLVAAAAVVVFHALLLALGYRRRTALVLAIALAISTPLLPYSKSFMREPALMLAVLGATLEAVRGRWARSGLWLGAGMLIKATLVVEAPLLAVYLVLRSGRHRAPVATGRALAALAAAPLAATFVLLLYNWLRFESVTRTGYDPTVDTFSTPLLVGLYGQLLSSGKSLFLYAPVGIAALWGYTRLWRRDRAMTWLTASILIANLLLHARFASWAGEGSWGPRYLVPFLPWFILPAAELLDGARRAAHRAVYALLVLGIIVQIGGSAIYFGSYMRELGEYPYQRDFSDPLFMVRSHFVPNDSPLVGHWRLLVRNLRLLAGPDRPALGLQNDAPGRLPLAEEDRDKLRYVVDFWFCYGLYAGAPAPRVLAPALLLLGLTAAASARLESGGDST